jgi:5-methylcytosine-specific restriction endonuclease McrA
VSPEEYTRASRAAQGLPPTIEDPGVLRRVAELLTSDLSDDEWIDQLVATAKERRRERETRDWCCWPCWRAERTPNAPLPRHPASYRRMPSSKRILKRWAVRLVALGKVRTYQEAMAVGPAWCFACGCREGGLKETVRAHILPRCEGGNERAENLHLLCAGCHDQSETLSGADYWHWFKGEGFFERIFRSRFGDMLKAMLAREAG